MFDLAAEQRRRLKPRVCEHEDLELDAESKLVIVKRAVAKRANALMSGWGVIDSRVFEAATCLTNKLEASTVPSHASGSSIVAGERAKH